MWIKFKKEEREKEEKKRKNYDRGVFKLFSLITITSYKDKYYFYFYFWECDGECEV